MRFTAIAVAFLSILAVAPGRAAPIAVPDSALGSRAALEAAIPDLARQALESLPDDPSLASEYRFRFHLAASQWSDALSSLEQWQGLQPAAAPGDTVQRYLRQELHARARLLEERERIPYGAALTKALLQKFSTFDDRTAADSAWALGLPPAAARASLDRQLEQLAGQRTLTSAQLFESLWWHGVQQATSGYAPVLDAAIAADDERRFVIERGVLIEMRDGAHVAADIVRPKRLTGPQPAVLHFTIYTSPPINLRDAKDAAVRGFVGVFANARGKYLSTDRIVPWETEVRDTHDVIAWIARQPWSDGKVGMFGHSYAGFTQWAAAKDAPAALKTIVPSGASFPGNGLPMQNNVFSNANYGWSLQVTSDRYMGDPALFDWSRWSSLSTRWFESGRPFREIDAVDGTPNEVLQRQLRHPSYDAYWRAMQPYRDEFAKIDIPVLTLTGYFDDAGSTAVNYLVDHQRFNPNANHTLFIGPYSHPTVLTPWRDATVNGYAMDPVANVDTLGLVYAWFEHVLRGAPRPRLLADRINYQVMGTNEWRHAPSIGKMAGERRRLYLTADRVGARYDLSARRPSASGFVEQRIDFADRATTHNLYPVRAYETAPDQPTRLAYVTAPFDEPVCVCGLVTGVLRAEIDRRDFDFTWSLYEALPDGRYFNLSYYLGRASYAADPSTRALLTPGKTATLPFSQSRLTARQLAKGSRLLLLLTVNKNAYAQVNYGTGKDVSDESIADAGRPLRVRWHDDSFIEVPLTRAPGPRPTTRARD